MEGDDPDEDPGDPADSVSFSMDYSLALERARPSLTKLEIDLLGALVEAQDNELRAGRIKALLGLSHHAVVNSTIARLAKKLTTEVGAEPPKRPDGTPRWWHVVAEGRRASVPGRFFWTLRPALRDAALELGICTLDDGPFPEEAVTDSEELLREGALKRVTVNAYERNPVARRRCIEHHGTTCAVCGFSFGETYGQIAEGVIHVHHLRQLADRSGEEHQVDPIADLRPVCPNCHVVLHLQSPPLSIEELKAVLVEQGSS